MVACGWNGLLLLFVLVAGESTQVAAQAPLTVSSEVVVVSNSVPRELITQEVGKEIWAGKLAGCFRLKRPKMLGI